MSGEIEVFQLQKGLKRDFERKIRALRKKAEEFRARGDLTRAENCLFLARYLEEFLAEYEG
ncbi:MAG: hypothetical protein QXX59_08900 [Candidatus Bathyarchaeia archaeon]